MRPVNPIVDALVSRLDANEREAFEERAGILQFEAGNERELAEALALLEVIRLHPLAGSGLVVLRCTVAGALVTVLGADSTATWAHLDALGATGVGAGDLGRALSSLGGAARLTPL